MHNIAEGVSLSYQQLHAQVLQLASSLSHLLKIREESELPSALEIPRIVVLSSNSSKDVVLLLACAYLGVPFSPIHESFSEAELLQMILVLQPTVRAITLRLDTHLPLFPHRKCFVSSPFPHACRYWCVETLRPSAHLQCTQRCMRHLSRAPWCPGALKSIQILFLCQLSPPTTQQQPSHASPSPMLTSLLSCLPAAPPARPKPFFSRTVVCASLS